MGRWNEFLVFDPMQDSVVICQVPTGMVTFL